MKKHYYNRICSDCGRRFLGKKMDYRCAICVENPNVTIEERGQRCIGFHSTDHVRHD